MAAKFVLKKGSTGKFRFNLLSTNGKVVATSEAYESRAAAIKGIESVRKHAGDADLDDQTKGTTKTATKTQTNKKSADEKSTDKARSRAKPSGEKRTAREDGAGSDGSMEINLGTCHYGGLDEEATTMAVRTDGTGWIGICDDHKQQAQQDGFEVDSAQR